MGWVKNINIVDARKLSALFCEYFKLASCMVYYVDAFHDKDDMGVYFNTSPTILIVDKCPNKIGILMHELTHHLAFEKYDLNEEIRPHGPKYQLAKDRVERWCNKYISSRPNWAKSLGAYQHLKDMKDFKL